MPSISKLYDSRKSCYSAIFEMTIKDFLGLVEHAYSSNGGIDGQRQPLRTASASRIRARMKSDIGLGAVLPPIVIGVLNPMKTVEEVMAEFESRAHSDWKSLNPQDLSIIDGMQRTTAIKEAVAENGTIENSKIRVEFWIASDINALIYRMLILNTGQVPWNTRRQLEVVFSSIVSTLKSATPNAEIFRLDEKRRRSKAGEFQADTVIEMFLVFLSRKFKIDATEQIADEYAKLDVMETTSDSKSFGYFCSILGLLVSIDGVFARISASGSDSGRFSSGFDVFSSAPACSGFAFAASLRIFGKLGSTRTSVEQDTAYFQLKAECEEFIRKLSSIDDASLRDFLSLPVLAEIMATVEAKKAIGDSQREIFSNAFSHLFREKFDVGSLEECWRIG